MTLTEYINQAEPKRGVSVQLNRDEYVIGNFIGSYLFKVAPVSIHAFPEYQYAVKEGSNLVWTTDSDGNPKNISVFLINENNSRGNL